MSTATKDTGIYFRTDEKTKKSFSELCAELGLSVSTALDMILKSSVRNREIPVKLSVVKKPVALDDLTDKDIDNMVIDGREQIKDGNYYTKEEFMKHLDALGDKYGL